MEGQKVGETQSQIAVKVGNFIQIYNKPPTK